MNEEMSKKLAKMMNVTRGANLNDLQELTQVFISVIKELKDALEANMEENKGEMSNHMKEMSKEMQTMDNMCMEMMSEMKTANMQNIQNTRDALMKEIVKVESMIPSMPDMPDLKEWAKQIEGKIKVPSMDEIGQALPKYNQQIRNGLELLQGDERLDKTAIKGLEDIERDIEKLKTQQGKAIHVGGAGNVASVGLSGYYTPSGTVNGINTTFNFVSIPNVIVVDGIMIRKTAADGTINWTGDSTVVLTIAPTFEIYSLA